MPVPSSSLKSVLIAGGAGYIGQVLTRQLIAAGCKVTILDRLLHGFEQGQTISLLPGVEMVEGDIRDTELVAWSMRDQQAAILLAALVGEKACDLSPEETWEVNYRAPLSFFQAARRVGIHRLIFTSTDSCYGAREGEKLDEESPLAPLTLYARLKAQVETELLDQSRDWLGVPVVTVLRLATVYGLSDRIRFDLAANLLVREALLKGRAVIYSGEQWRPMVSVSDVARAFIKVLEAPTSLVASEIFNVGSDRQNIQFKELGNILKTIIPNSVIETIPADPDLRDYYVKFGKISRVLAFNAQTELFDGLQAVKVALENGFPADPYARLWRNTQ
ncbi:MAG: NAD(P)-dependent oxidoreductase [Deltaproteobacteria bacterium]|jgi:nucleoside-diphosphate-sugar epimerase|nr:NAD(P)-dependent oxidoreductase [Deltaproteobacteria bacterium]